MLSILEIIIK